MFKGSYVALVTPFKNGGAEIDETAYADMVEWHVEQGTHGLVPCGTTAESATLSDEEHKRLIEIAVETSAGRVPVMAGAGSNSTVKAIKYTQVAKDAGADGVLLVAPYYNKPNQEGLYQHFKAIHDQVTIPIVLYNIPGRSVIRMEDATIERLAALPNIVGIKDATGDLEQPLRTKCALGEGFAQLSGEDSTVVPFLSQGGVGCISVTANVAPKLCADLHNAWMNGNLERVMEINESLLPLHQAMFCETNPAPAKYALSLIKGINANVRLPLVEISDASKKQVQKALQDLNLV